MGPNPHFAEPASLIIPLLLSQTLCGAGPDVSGTQ